MFIPTRIPEFAKSLEKYAYHNTTLTLQHTGYYISYSFRIRRSDVFLLACDVFIEIMLYSGAAFDV